MKRLLLTTLVAAMGATAHAGSISMDSRVDYEATNYNDAAKAAGAQNYNRFNMQTLRLDANGKFDDATSFRVRFNLLGGGLGATANKRDSANEAIQFGYIQHKFMDNFSLQLGRIITDIGGIEGMTAGPDLYFTSAAYGQESNLRYEAGAKGIFSVAGQEIELMATNLESDSTTTGTSSGTFNQTHQAWGVVWKGNFMDKTLMPVLSWHKEDIGLNGTETKTNNFYAAGLKYDMAPMFVEADYLWNTFDSQTTAGKQDKTTSLVATLGYKMDNWVGKLKFEDSKVDTEGASTTATVKYTGYQLAAEYQPTGDKNFRYHVAYVSRDAKADGVDTVTQQSLFVGTRIMADFLK